MPPGTRKKKRSNDRSKLLKGTSPTETKHVIIAQDLRDRVRTGELVMI